jgi:hypothetical protein
MLLIRLLAFRSGSSHLVHSFGQVSCCLLPTLRQKRFVLAAKRGLCWRVERQLATLSRHKLSLYWRVSVRQHRDLSAGEQLKNPIALRFSG